MTRYFRCIAIVAMALVAVACSNAKTIQESAVDAGAQRSFDAPYEKVLNAARAAMVQLDLTPSVERDEPEGYVMVFWRPVRFGSWGEVGRVIVVKSDSPPITVHAIYEKRMNLPFDTSGIFGRNLFSRMDVFLSSPVVSSETPL